MSTPRTRARASRKAQGLHAVIRDASVLTTIAGVLRSANNDEGPTEAEPSSEIVETRATTPKESTNELYQELPSGI